MEELKSRVDTIAEFSQIILPPQNSQQERHNYFYFEGIYLHLRKVCELIALSMLLVHRMDGSPTAAKLLKEWKADALIDEVAKLNPIGFPKRIQAPEAAPGSVETVKEYPSVFSGADIKSLYYECGDKMHIGSLKNVLRNHTRELNLPVIQKWVERFQLGLANHMIVMPSVRRSIIVTMEDPKTKSVSCQFATLMQ